MKVLLLAGGAGFVGSNFSRYFLKRNKNFVIINIDKMLYPESIFNIKDLEKSPRYHFIRGDICNYELVNYILKRYKPDFIINFADRSDNGKSAGLPSVIASDNIMGTLTLLENARRIWGKNCMSANRFIQVSTDEVYGNTNNNNEYYLEDSVLSPEDPHAASKAGADLMVTAFSKAYKLPAIITRSCSNYGPYQNAEKFVPSCIISALQDKPMPPGSTDINTKEWIHVLDHCVAIIRVLFYGRPGEVYNIGTGEEYSNSDIAKKILGLAGKPIQCDEPAGEKPKARRALNSYKIKSNLIWANKFRLGDGLKDTIEWYRANRSL